MFVFNSFLPVRLYISKIMSVQVFIAQNGHFVESAFLLLAIAVSSES